MSSSEQPARQDARVSTGVPGLDAVLGGGLVSSGAYVFVGERAAQPGGPAGPVLDVPMEVGPSAVAENLFFLRHVELEGRLRRLLSIFKMRDTRHPGTGHF
ncbi:hypothetical protein [Myxococcus xanthus]|uniref:hypothetical protein n=1 Tax=Myxococcus xanthus TaxID=34 RepID=UPI00112716AB|nr:hypothetical protein [Myxococcus xanthus]